MQKIASLLRFRTSKHYSIGTTILHHNTLSPTRCFGTTSHFNSYNFLLAPWILELKHHKLHFALDFTLVTLSFCGWEAFPMLKAVAHTRSLRPSHQWHHKFQVSLWCITCAHGVVGSSQGEVHLNVTSDF